MDYKVCRLCCENDATSYIYQMDTDNVDIRAKIMYCCSKLVIKEDDGLPSYICIRCEQELQNYYRFVLKCEAAEKKLRDQCYDVALNSGARYGDYEPKVEIKSELNDDDHQYDEEPPDNSGVNNFIESKSQVRKKRAYKKRTSYKSLESLKCTVCGRICAHPSALAAHMRVHTNEKPYLCTLCDKRYKDSSNLKRHINRNHHLQRERNFVCEHCGKGFYSRRDIRVHMRTHTGETPYVCNICSKSFAQTSTLLRHKLRHAGTKSHSCPTCSKAFCTKEELRNHAMVHTTEKKFSCPICKIAFKYSNNVRKHLRMHMEPNRFVCNHCGRAFNLKGNLKMHIDRLHSEKSGFCNICSKSMSNIEVHMWRHTGQRPLKCELCSSSFFEQKALGRHMNYKHKQTEKYKCHVDGCLMGFPSKPMLDVHTAKLHTTNIPFPCDRCSRGFYRKNDLARHKIGTHKERLL
ncbi:hypothetical protein O3G_MSEX011491 [Manduca sexta]|uniref:Uncharacterized protein n=1 Tax=Manduca sexta TaxID=7130 RepID=A0A921ZLE1_MANSE|nr:hypothetical protein O3G_MSEX011491 [Manduca sexta]